DTFVSNAANGKFDKMILAVRESATDPDSYLETLLPGDPLNVAGVNDSKLTEMVKRQRRTFKDSARRDIVYDIQRYCAQQVYYACGPSPSVVAAWLPYVIDFGPNIGPDYGGRLMSPRVDKSTPKTPPPAPPPPSSPPPRPPPPPPTPRSPPPP